MNHSRIENTPLSFGTDPFIDLQRGQRQQVYKIKNVFLRQRIADPPKLINGYEWRLVPSLATRQ